MNFTECAETTGNTLLLEHKSKIITLAPAPVQSRSQCQQRLQHGAHPALRCPRNGTARTSLGLENLLSCVSQGNRQLKCSLRAVCLLQAPSWALISISAFWHCSVETSPPTAIWAVQDGASGVPYKFSLAIPTSPNQKCTCFAPAGKSTLPPWAVRLF